MFQNTSAKNYLVESMPGKQFWNRLSRLHNSLLYRTRYNILKIGESHIYCSKGK